MSSLERSNPAKNMDAEMTININVIYKGISDKKYNISPANRRSK